MSIETRLRNTGATSSAGGGSSGSGSSVTNTITQNGHGFVVGNVVYLNASTYTLARADLANTAEVIGIVSSITDANTFVLTTEGKVTGLSGLVSGTAYFLSPSSAGALTPTEPTTQNQISKPILIADSTTSGQFFNMRGEVINAATSSKSLVDTYAYTYAGGF